jgi:hypothetical protein
MAAAHAVAPVSVLRLRTMDKKAKTPKKPKVVKPKVARV